MDMNLGKFQEMVRDRKAWHAAVHGVRESDKTGELNSNMLKQQICHSNSFPSPRGHPSEIKTVIQSNLWVNR